MLGRHALSSVVLAYLVGCYRPDLHDCTVRCSSPGDCTGGQVCSDGWCAMPGVGAQCRPTDASIDTHRDAAPDGKDKDISLCLQGCTNGTCDDQGVCVIDCSATDACDATDVNCPANLPCRVVCGDHACMHHVNCNTATSCEVDCTGPSACGDEIHCNTGSCVVTCNGDSSCKRRVRCGTSCACDVTCSGTNSCAEISECPLAGACALGRGCSSQLAGCDTCP